MCLDSIIDKWAHQTVYIYHATSTFDTYGNPATATSSAHTAIVQKTMKLVRTQKGVEKVANTEIFLRSTYPVGYADRIELPSGETPVILAIESPVDFAGITAYYRVYT